MSVQDVIICPRCRKKTFVYEIELRNREEWGICRRCGYGFEIIMVLQCIDCGKLYEDFDVYELWYFPTCQSRRGHPGYGLPIFKCPNCNSFRMVVDLFEKPEPPRVREIKTSELRPMSELKGLLKGTGSNETMRKQPGGGVDVPPTKPPAHSKLEASDA